MDGVGKRVLVCDDERVIVRLLQANLERRGYEVVCTFNGKEAVERLQQEHFDRVVLDIVMPYMDGLEVLHWIRTNERTRGLSVTLITTQANLLQEKIDEMPYGVDALISKPFDLAELY